MEELPLFQHTYQNNEVIKPFRNEGFKFPEKLVFAFITDANLLELVTRKNAKVVGEFLTVSNMFEIYSIKTAKGEIGLCRAPLGAPAATQLLDFLIAYGVKEIVAVGSCGVLVDKPEGELFVLNKALRDEGTSYHYVKPETWAYPDEQLKNRLIEYLTAQKIKFELITSWTTDGFFRETKDQVQKNINLGCSVVEMEAAALAACAKFRKVKFGQILYSGDSLANLEIHDARNFGEASQLIVTTIAINFMNSLF